MRAPETFAAELKRITRPITRSMKIFNMRYHLSRYPRDLVAFWWRIEGDLPYLTSRIAFEAFKRGEKPRTLHKGPPEWPDGGANIIRLPVRNRA